MKNRKFFSIKSAIAAGFLACSALGVMASTNSIGFNFTGSDATYGGPYVNSGKTLSLLPTDLAGVAPYAQTNWNNIDRYGTGAFMITNSAGGTNVLIMQWDSTSAGSRGTASLGTPDGKLMDGVDYDSYGNGAATPMSSSIFGSPNNDKPSLFISGLNAWWTNNPGAECYGVVMYVEPMTSYNPTVECYVESATGDATAGTMVEGPSVTPHYFAQLTTASIFTGTYVRATSTSSGSATAGANYVVLGGITNDAIIIRCQSPGYVGGVAGFQLVPIYPGVPTVAAPTISPSSTVFGGATVTLTENASPDPIHTNLWYQWQTDGGAGGLANNNILDATNGTYTFTTASSNSTYTLQFQIIVTNIFGAATSSVVSLTVTPSPPVVTTDTTPGAGDSSANVYAFANGSITFGTAFAGTQPIGYQWQADTGGGFANILDATNTAVTLTNLQLSNSGNYQDVATNAFGAKTNTPAALTVLADPAAPDPSQAYAYAVFNDNPVAYWRFNETTYDVSANSVQAYDYSGHNLNATYGHGTAVFDNGLNSSSSFPGFESSNPSLSLINGYPNCYVTAPPLNLNTNTVTISMWINPNAVVGTYWGLLTWGNTTNGDKAGFGFGSNQQTNNGIAVAELGYAWNTNSSATYNWHSGLYAPVGQWSFISLVITPTNSTIYLYYQDGSGTHLSKAVQTITNSPEAFGGSGGTVWIGMDGYTGRTFDGYIDEVSVFNKSLTEAQIQALYSAGSGITSVAPYISSDITANPTNSNNLFPGQVPVQLTAAGAGMPSPTQYQWQVGSGGVFTNVPNSGSFSGANSGTLTINPVTAANYLDYQLVVSSINGSATSSVYHVSFATVPANGIWTACYQFTNASGSLWYSAYGSGSYTGPGILGHGGFWNPIPGGGQWAGGNFTSVSDYMDDGATHSGVICRFNGASFSIAGATQAYSSTNRAGLLSQFAYYFPGVGVAVTNAITMSLPNGVYNLAFHSDVISGGNWGNVGTIFTVHGANGNQSDATTNTGQSAYFMNHDTSVIITNVLVTNGVLNVDATPSSPTKGELSINAAEVQLVSYGTPTAGFSAQATNVYVNQWFAFYDQASIVTNVVWDFGDGNIYTNINGTVYHGYSTPGTYTVSQTVTGPGGTASVTKTSYIHVFAQPGNGDSSMSSGSFIFSGTGGIPGDPYRILTSTNLALPLANWTPVLTNTFGMDGSYSYTNSSPTNGANFFIMVSP